MDKKIKITDKNYTFDFGKLIDQMNRYLHETISRFFGKDGDYIHRVYAGKNIEMALVYRDVKYPSEATLTIRGGQEEIEDLEKSLITSKFVLAQI